MDALLAEGELNLTGHMVRAFHQIDDRDNVANPFASIGAQVGLRGEDRAVHAVWWNSRPSSNVNVGR